MARNWSSAFFCMFMDRDRVEVHEHVKKEQSQYQAFLNKRAWSIKDLGSQGNWTLQYLPPSFAIECLQLQKHK